jgi:translocation and assembly module TamA
VIARSVDVDVDVDVVGDGDVAIRRVLNEASSGAGRSSPSPSPSTSTVWALAFVLLAACATPSAPKEGHPVLMGIDFTGNANISSGELRDKLATEASAGVFSRTTRYYDEDLFAIDQRRIERHYQSKGFFEARVEAVDVLRDREGRVTLLVHIVEGPRARISNFHVEGLEKLPKGQQADVIDESDLRVGEGFDEDKYERAKVRVVNALRERGYAEAKVIGKVEVFPEEARAQIVLVAETGLQYRFGRVVVSGNRNVPADAIIRATGIQKGDLYKPSALELAQQHVYNLGAFAGVRVGLEPLGSSPVASVRVSVREAPFQTVRAGVGFQIEPQLVEVPRLRAEYINTNLLGGLRRLELTATGGYAFTPSILEPAKTGAILKTSAQITNPNVFLPSLDFISRGEYTRDVEVSFDYQRVAARFSLLYRRGRHSLQPALNFERYFAVNVPVSAREAGLSTAGVVSQNAQPSLLRDACESSCTLTYPEIRYTYDGRDSILEPTRGYYVTIDLQQTLRPGSFTYFRAEPEFRGYLSLGGRVVVAGRVDYGSILLPAGDKSPATVRFFAGGANSNRGYGANRQGPKYGGLPTGFVPTNVAADQTGGRFTAAVPQGGNGLFLLQGEVRVRTDWPLGNLAVVAFLDASRVTSRAQLPWESALEVAPGLGLRYITPFGPIRLDFGYVVNPQDQMAFNTVQPVFAPLVTQPTLVSVYCGSSCIHETRWAYHITLGEAF